MLKSKIKSCFIKFAKIIGIPKLTRDWYLKSLMESFQADEYGHGADINSADLGYGWIHYGLIRQQKPKKLLCVGSRYGFIPSLMAQACKDNNFGKVDFIDAGYGDKDLNNWTGVGYWKTAKGKTSFEKFGLKNYIHLYIMTTAAFVDQHPKRIYNYIYIDGDHSLEGVTIDFDLFWSKLKKGGFMIFHDICMKGTYTEGKYGVWQFWQNLEKDLGGGWIKIGKPGLGLGIIQKI